MNRVVWPKQFSIFPLESSIDFICSEQASLPLCPCVSPSPLHSFLGIAFSFLFSLLAVKAVFTAMSSSSFVASSMFG